MKNKKQDKKEKKAVEEAIKEILDEVEAVKEVESNSPIKSKEQELTNTLQRLQAEFDNYRKRVDKEKQDFAKYANKELVQQLLPVVDNFELALKNQNCDKEFVKGVELIFSQFHQVLEDQGLQKIKAEGKFNPYTQEALLAEESDEEDGTVLEVLQQGYKINDEVIRHAKVKVAKNNK
ncbi:MAG: nucleotide exchange factor GrpE [Nanoarchaeota archaeon]|nr:nucleotide exchange factor GrpE [Nanoarchaeota archaeon]